MEKCKKKVKTKVTKHIQINTRMIQAHVCLGKNNSNNSGAEYPQLELNMYRTHRLRKKITRRKKKVWLVMACYLHSVNS